MPDLLLFAPTESISIDQESNRLSMFHLAEQFNFPQFPVAIPQLVLITIWQRSANEDEDDGFAQTVVIRDPEGSPVIPPRRVLFKLPRRRHRLLYMFNGVPISRAGLHEIRLYCTSAEVEMPKPEHLRAIFPVEVRQVVPQQQQRQAGPPSEE